MKLLRQKKTDHGAAPETERGKNVRLAIDIEIENRFNPTVRCPQSSEKRCQSFRSFVPTLVGDQESHDCV